MTDALITSPQNPRIKSLVKLADRKGRQVAGLFAVEGNREIERALESGYDASEIYFCREIMSKGAEKILAGLRRRLTASAIFEITASAYEKIAVREGSEGLVVTFKPAARSLTDWTPGKLPFILMTEDIEKPGNLGAMLRTADGAGVDGVLVLSRSADIYSPQVIRSSLGAVFSNRVMTCSNEDAFEFCRKWKISTVVASPEAKSSWSTVNGKGAVAVLTGSEANGVSDWWKSRATAMVAIPMRGKVDSLNVSVATAIMLYEVRRQRDA